MDGINKQNDLLDRFNWDGTPINPPPQRPTPQQQTTQTIAQTALTQLREASDDEMSPVGSRAPSTLEEKKENESGIEELIGKFEQIRVTLLKGVAPAALPSANDIKHATNEQFNALTKGAQNGDDLEELKILVRYSPVPFTTQMLEQAIVTADHFGNLEFLCDVYIGVIEDLSDEPMTEGVIPILSALKHRLVPSELQEAAIYHAVCAGLFSQEEGPILEALDGFKPEIQIEALIEVIKTAKEEEEPPEHVKILQDHVSSLKEKLKGESAQKRRRTGPKLG